MSPRRVGLGITKWGIAEALEGIQQAEALGVPAVWLTTGGGGRASPDALTILAAAAVRTKRILLGTAVVPTWSRHPVTVAQQAQVVAGLAPGRLRLGVGPGHRFSMEKAYGVEFQAPLGHLREYLRILKALLQQGSVKFEGKYYRADDSIERPLDVPVMMSALQRRSFELCGAEADGAIPWVCPRAYLATVALPAMREAAEAAGRPVPPLIAQAPVCLHDRVEEVRAATREQVSNYPRMPFYARMFADAGFPEALELKDWSDRILDEVVVWGDERQVKERLRGLFRLGASEVIASPILVGRDRAASLERTLKVLAEVSRE
ncbi:MAG: LLM class flavin-dependent oxidoreductase [Chloroflexi bacterium]|nr:LLM class flavin-dependent oxidoreductase [Chloroflexota bacterium]